MSCIRWLATARRRVVVSLVANAYSAVWQAHRPTSIRSPVGSDRGQVGATTSNRPFVPGRPRSMPNPLLDRPRATARGGRNTRPGWRCLAFAHVMGLPCGGVRREVLGLVTKTGKGQERRSCFRAVAKSSGCTQRPFCVHFSRQRDTWGKRGDLRNHRCSSPTPLMPDATWSARCISHRVGADEPHRRIKEKNRRRSHASIGRSAIISQ